MFDDLWNEKSEIVEACWAAKGFWNSRLSSGKSYFFSCVSEPGLDWPDPDKTIEKTNGSGSDLRVKNLSWSTFDTRKTLIRIRPSRKKTGSGLESDNQETTLSLDLDPILEKPSSGSDYREKKLGSDPRVQKSIANISVESLPSFLFIRFP